MQDGANRARIDLEAAGGVEASRLERSLGLRVKRVGRGRYQVWGGSEPHWVDLYTTRMPRCDCGDHLWREKVCKHILAVMLREGDERVIREVGGLVAGLRESVREAKRRPRAGPRPRRRERGGGSAQDTIGPDVTRRSGQGAGRPSKLGA